MEIGTIIKSAYRNPFIHEAPNSLKMKEEKNDHDQMPKKLMESIRKGIKKARRNKRYGDLKKLTKMATIVQRQIYSL